MAYWTQAKIEELIGTERVRQLTDDARDGQIDTAIVARCGNDADAIIDSFIAAKYTTPVVPTPPMLETASITIAAWRMFARRAIKIPEHLDKMYEQVMEWLKAVRDGIAVVPAVDQTAVEFKTDRSFEKDREFRDKWDGGSTDSEKAGTFGTFEDVIR